MYITLTPFSMIVYKASMLRNIENEKTTIIMLTILGLGITITAYAFITLPPEATITKTTVAQVTSKNHYVRLSMLIPIGDNIAGIPLLEIVYSVTASNGEQIQVDQNQYKSINEGDQIVINYWERGWLDGKMIGDS